MSKIEKLYLIQTDRHKTVGLDTKFLSLLSVEEQKEINKIVSEIDKKLSFYARILIRCLACDTLGISNEDLRFSKNQYGKPYVLEHPNFYYNISHTKDALVVGIAQTTIGVDIEKMGEANLKIAKRFFTDNENAHLLENTQKQDQLFYELWTKKEAYIKCMGKGMSIPLQSFDVVSEPLREKMSTFLIDEYIVSVCNEKHFANENVLVLSEQDLYHKMLKLHISQN